MKYLINLLLLFALSITATQTSANEQNIADLPITLLSGDTVKLSQYKDNKPVYLKFWASWCQPCMKEMPHLQHVYEQYGDKIQVIAINLGVNDDAEAVDKVKKQFGLTMPIAIDTSGDLAQAANLIGTPYHLLFNKEGDAVHKGHEASEELDEKIKSLIAEKSADLQSVTLIDKAETSAKADSGTKGITARLFVATWCDSYFEKTRPEMSKSCINAQQEVNSLSQKYPQINWEGVVSRLWTGEEELAAYKKKYDIPYPLNIDSSNAVFFANKVKDFPTLILSKEGKEVLRIKEFDDSIALVKKLKAITDTL